MQISTEARSVLEAVRNANRPVTVFALVQQLNPSRGEMGGALEAWRQRQMELLQLFSDLHEAGHLESLPRDPGQHSETFILSVRGDDLLRRAPAVQVRHEVSAVDGRRPRSLRDRLTRRGQPALRSH
ncbi:hypothetical protein [Geodermatophilus sp. CPCC 206100]|uniref:hypothetical protein n=1 Tax=Geodermatophilus sp. CPCC 206100 TaxID=3020054 RepID=UPI003B004422